MKLRHKHKETLTIDVPNPCTISQLKQILVQSLLNSPSPDSVRLSLNRKDELQSNGGDSLHSHGIAAGDLIYFSLEKPAAAAMSPNPQNTLPQISGIDTEKGGIEETIEEMEVDNEDKSFYVPGFSRKVEMAELGHGPGKDLRLIIIGVHVVMLETGFVCFDKNTNTIVDGFTYLNKWSSRKSNVSLSYTLPQSLSCSPIKTVVLRFQTLGKFINVYSALQNGLGKKSSTHHVQLDEDQMAPFLTAVQANSGVETSILGTLEKSVFEFWRNVKDNIVLPLLIDLCEEIGLPLPQCFMKLPTDLKIRILESLNGVDVARASCVCSELRHLGSSNNLWKMKYAKEFGHTDKHKEGIWKMRFAKDWESLKLSRAREVPNEVPLFRVITYYIYQDPIRIRYPNPIVNPRVPRRNFLMSRRGH